jgi:rhodanese-related sulfurtransferase
MTGAASRPVPRPGNQAVAPATIDDLLIEARSGLARLDPRAAFRAIRDGAVLIDTRPEWQRRADGEIPGALVIERNHLEWRCDPSSPARVPEAADHQVAWIVCCDEGYSSSLAAASLQALGLSNATDVIGGFRAWRAAGLPVARPAKPSPSRVTAGQEYLLTCYPIGSAHLKLSARAVHKGGTIVAFGYYEAANRGTGALRDILSQYMGP